MANIKQQKKRNKTNEKRRLKNASYKSSVKTAIKKFKAAAVASEKIQALTLLNYVNKKLDKGLSKGIYHSNFVSRNKSNFSKMFNQI
ncbi:30S ribosomal protein S20 [Candidatus Phytoplasma pruni]|uniref:Small ribosomal subunit protein bS20 n=1 Tax=Candidatus Phytoplasma pruni TaxID=479893 RepID=A0A0M1MZI7_9MOLU|nr:30S ribosomal protein S20 [Candidatus Phytoplasma pruni]KOR75317.1 30S ribosomal protein S20 [Candidatus Phytoplasma pruni]MDW3618035.1 30S ribosomal protein S20 [Candidatus Phytoplasma pruni]